MIFCMIILLVVQCVIIVRLYATLDRIEDNLVDIELTYERMRCVITYLKDCIQYSDYIEPYDKSNLGR